MRDRTACLQYYLHRRQMMPAGRPLLLNEFNLKDPEARCFQMYGMDFIKEYGNGFILRTEKIPNPVEFVNRPQIHVPDETAYNARPYFVPNWIRSDRIEIHGSLLPYTHYAGGIKSKLLIRPPFRLQSVQDCIYPDGVNPCVWVHNDVDNEPITEEFDITESSKGDGMYSSRNYGGKVWANRKLNFSMLCWHPIGIHTFDLVVEPSRTRWYCDGKLYKTVIGMFDLRYFILVTLVVTKPGVPEIEWRIQSLTLDI
jgi:hypothetical protein